MKKFSFPIEKETKMFAKNILQLVGECTVQFESFLVTAKIRKMSTLIAKMHRNTISSS